MQKYMQSLIIKIYSRQSSRNPSFVMVEMDKQKKCSYHCGVYTIAVATSLAFGIDPIDVIFKQDAT